MMNKNAFWVVVCAVLVFSVTAKVEASNAGVKIAFVDLRQALNETNEGKRAMKRLQREKDNLQKKVDQKEQSILKMQEGIKEQQSILSQEALQRRAQEYYAAVQELQQSYAQFQQELAAQEMKATQSILARMETIVAEIGKKGGYTMIYDRSSGAVVYAPSSLDLTNQLIQQYNAKHK